MSLPLSPTLIGEIPGISLMETGVFSEWTFTGTKSDGTKVEVTGCDSIYIQRW